MAGDLVPLFLGAQWQSGAPAAGAVHRRRRQRGGNQQLARVHDPQSLAPDRGLQCRPAAAARARDVHPCADLWRAGRRLCDCRRECRHGHRGLHLAPWRLGFAPARFVAAAWRPVAASLGCASPCGSCARHWRRPPISAGTHGRWPFPLRWVPLHFVGCTLALWFACGRPDGAERRLVTVFARGFRMRLRRA